MSINRNFQLTHFPNGTTDYSDRGFPNITNEYLVLLCQEDNDGVVSDGVVPIGILLPEPSPSDYYKCNHTFSDGSVVEAIFFGKTFPAPGNVGSLGLNYTPTSLSHSGFIVDQLAKAYMDKNLGLSSGGSSGGTVDLTPIQNAIIALSSKIDGFGKYNLLDLNGQFGSYRNGTKVLISGHTEEYTVLSSSLIWDDKMGVLMLTYDLKNSKNEICPCSHPLLSLVPVIPTTPTNGA